MKALRLLAYALVVLAVPLWATRGCPAEAPTNPPPLGTQYAGPFPSIPPVQIVGALTYRRDQLVRLAVTGLDDKASVEWDVLPDGKADSEEVRDRLFFTGPPGRYSVIVRVAVIKDGAIVKTRRRVGVTILAEGQQPAPEAPPAPPAPVKPPPPPPRPEAPILDPKAATARIVVGRFACTTAPVAPVRIDGRVDMACAAHCARGVGEKGTVTFPDGRTVEVICTAWKGTHGKAMAPDLAWFTTVDPVAGRLPMVDLATSVPAPGTKVWQNGYGKTTNRAVITGTVRGNMPKEGMIAFNLRASVGDSGGPIFHAGTNELLATVCCGPDGTEIVYGGSCLTLAAMRPKVGAMPAPLRKEKPRDECRLPCLPLVTWPLLTGEDDLRADTPLVIYARDSGPGVEIKAEDVGPHHPVVREVRKHAYADGATGGGVASVIALLIVELVRLLIARRNAPPPGTPPQETVRLARKDDGGAFRHN